jgi:bifunctional DNA-binding transcriptional regulator/antitoxin component of YhaV-PrlF toxin-antitoxin module
MNQAKIQDGGKLTLPLEVRKWLRIKDGDRVAFIRDEQGVRMVNSSILALEKAQEALTGAAERAGFKSEDDIVKYCKEVRRELYEERYANND